MESTYLAKPLHDRAPDGSLSPDPEKIVPPPPASSSLSKPSNFRVWLMVMLPLILHGSITALIIIFITSYVNNRDFHLDRRPLVKLDNGTMVPWTHYAPVQTDIVTILTVMLAVLRLVAACWIGPMVWRCAFILMEEFGLRPTQLSRLVSYGVLTGSPIGAPVQGQRLLRLLIYAMLLVVLPVQLAAPVLTGSIRWVPSSAPPERLSDFMFWIRSIDSYEGWNDIQAVPKFLEYLIDVGSTRHFLAWGRDTSNVAMKRYVQEFSNLDINSTITNITLPYFTIEAIEWIENPTSTLTTDQLNILGNRTCPKVTVANHGCPIIVGGTTALIPDTFWSVPSTLSPSMIKERRLMVLNADTPHLEDSCDTPRFHVPDVSIVRIDSYCFYFAWVTYSAGSGTCHNCRISSSSTVQNDTALVLQEDYVTEVSLRLMPSVSAWTMIDIDKAMIPPWTNVHDHVVGMLTRSYAGAWMALYQVILTNFWLTGYAVSPRTIRAIVDLPRVYIWLGLQLLVTLSGLLFIYIQMQSGSSLIKNITLAPFYLDTSAIRQSSAYTQFWGGSARRVELDDGRLVLKRE